MPTLFLAHGSPTNAVSNNLFTQSLKTLSGKIPLPKAILVISAHWETEGTFITHMKFPKTIHDFYGFPKSLYEIQYPASGAPELAEKISEKIKIPKIELDDDSWGLDHGTWSLLRHLYPDANVPVIQMSLDRNQESLFHLQLGKQISFLRDENVLLLGSGNIVHNLSLVNWDPQAATPDWAIEFDEWVVTKIIERDFESLATDFINSRAGKLSHPTFEHFFPLLYILGASENDDKIEFPFEGFQNSTISMRCLKMFKDP